MGFIKETFLIDNHGAVRKVKLIGNSYVGYGLNVPLRWWNDNEKKFNDPFTNMSWTFGDP